MTTLTFHEPVLSEDEEHRLALEIEAGLFADEALASKTHPRGATHAELEVLRRQGEEAFGRYVRANLRLVRMVTFPVSQRCRVDPDDLFQEGVLGLMEAVRRYDHRRGARFATFALPWIRMRVGECTATRGGATGLPVSRAKAWVQVIAIRDSLEQDGLRRPTLAEIAGRTGRPVAQVRELLAYAPAVTWEPTDAVSSRWGVEQSGTDDLAIRRLLRRLDAQERDVIERLFGLGREPQSYEQVGAELGMSASTVRRRERNALDRLRTPAHGDAA